MSLSNLAAALTSSTTDQATLQKSLTDLITQPNYKMVAHMLLTTKVPIYWHNGSVGVTLNRPILEKITPALLPLAFRAMGLGNDIQSSSPLSPRLYDSFIDSYQEMKRRSPFVDSTLAARILYAFAKDNLNDLLKEEKNIDFILHLYNPHYETYHPHSLSLANAIIKRLTAKPSDDSLLDAVIKKFFSSNSLEKGILNTIRLYLHNPDTPENEKDTEGVKELLACILASNQEDLVQKFTRFAQQFTNREHRIHGTRRSYENAPGKATNVLYRAVYDLITQYNNDTPHPSWNTYKALREQNATQGKSSTLFPAWLTKLGKRRSETEQPVAVAMEEKIPTRRNSQ